MKSRLFLNRLFFIFLFCLTSLFAYSEAKLLVSPVGASVDVIRGESSFIALRVLIPKGYYIYGNPLGGVTGKPTSISVSYKDEELTVAPARYMPPKKHKDFEGNSVNIYERETYIFLPFVVENGDAAISVDIKNPPKYKLTIKFDALICSKDSCTSYTKKIDYEIIASNQPILRSHDIRTLYYKSLEVVDEIGETKESLGLTAIKDLSADLIPEINESFSPVYIKNIAIGNILFAILLGFLAGFILNFMPCVLPVIGLKILGLIKNNDDKKNFRLNIIFFISGILLSFIALAILIAIFGIKWGGLFQNSVFLIVMILIIFALSLSMFGVWNINSPNIYVRNRNQYLDSFLKGLFATLLATPCSGPLLGGVLVWTLSQNIVTVFSVFLSIGLGFSLPYIIFLINPKIVNIIPKSGEWTIVFERIMGFFLIFTIFFLLTVMEDKFVLPTILSIIFIAIAFFQYGYFGSINRSNNSRFVSIIMFFVIILLGLFLSYVVMAEKYSNKEKIIKETYSYEELIENIENGKTVIVNFSADWCINCKFVESMVFQNEKVIKTINDNDIVFLTADITNYNYEADTLMDKLGTKSIPFLAVFKSDDFTRPVCLRDIYSKGDLLKAID